MSELMNTKEQSSGKWHLLTSVSAAALIALFPQSASAGDDRPTVWIEVGAQLERLTNGQESFAPLFVTPLLENPFTPPAEVQRPPRYSFGQEGRISFQPEGSDWSFTAAIRYGRSNSSGNVHEETSPASAHAVQSAPLLGIYETGLVAPTTERFATTASRTQDTHLVLDFMAGKDVGLGAFGAHGSSTFSAGVRFAQFTSRSKVRIDADPDFAFSYKYLTSIFGIPGYFKLPAQSWNLYSGKMQLARSFTGAGPKLEWDANATLFGDQGSGAVTFDWGLNGALLFGRQKVSAHHETMAHRNLELSHGPLPTLYPTKVHDTSRSRSVVVPNIGGFAGLSMRFPNAKVSFGYRVDAFFGAMDGGIDTRKTYDRDFYGPFATISIGLGG
jgi:hypothetical protein